MRTRLIVVLALVAAIAVSLVVAGGASAGKKGTVGGKKGGAIMTATSGNAVVGTSLLRYRAAKGGELKGWVIVTGLVPDSTHAWHIHGRVPGGPAAPGNCTTQSDDVVVAFEDLTANANGVAIIRVDQTGVGKNPLLLGNYVNVHEMSSTDGVGPGIVCGMIKKAVV